MSWRWSVCGLMWITAPLVSLALMATAIPAMARPIESAELIINSLRASGYRVVVSGHGASKIAECTVLSVSALSPVTDVAASRNMRNRPTTIPVSTKVAFVTVAC